MITLSLPHPSQEGGQYRVKGNQYPVPPLKLHIKAQSFHFRPKLISILHIVYIKYEPVSSKRLFWTHWVLEFEYIWVYILWNALERSRKPPRLLTWLKYKVFYKSSLQLAALDSSWIGDVDGGCWPSNADTAFIKNKSMSRSNCTKVSPQRSKFAPTPVHSILALPLVSNRTCDSLLFMCYSKYYCSNNPAKPMDKFLFLVIIVRHGWVIAHSL